MQLSRTHSFSSAAFSLVEVLTSLAIFSIVLFVLSLALDASLDALSRSSSTNSMRSGVRIAIQSMEADLEGVIVDQPSSHSFGSMMVNSTQKTFFDKKKFMPIAINRSEGADQDQSFLNSATGYASLLFASAISTSRYRHPLRERIRFSDGDGLADFNQSAEAIGEVGLCGYYVAYTKDSKQPEASSSMKLYRHFRSGGITYGNGHANGVLAYCSDVFDPNSERTILTGSNWQNRSLPNIFSKRYTGPGIFNPVNVTQPWPLMGEDGLPANTEPPDFDSASWLDPNHDIHEFVFGDEPIVNNVIEFDCEPYKKVETSEGVFELFDTDSLNQYLGLSNSDWPILIKPDLIDVSISIVGEGAALLLDEESDWTMPDLEVSLDKLSTIDRIKRQQMQRFLFRANIK